MYSTNIMNKNNKIGFLNFNKYSKGTDNYKPANLYNNYEEINEPDESNEFNESNDNFDLMKKIERIMVINNNIDKIIETDLPNSIELYNELTILVVECQKYLEKTKIQITTY